MEKDNWVFQFGFVHCKVASYITSPVLCLGTKGGKEQRGDQKKGHLPTPVIPIHTFPVSPSFR